MTHSTPGLPRLLQAQIEVGDPAFFVLLAIVVLAYAALRWLPRLIAGPRRYLNVEQVRRRLASGTPVLVLDVRSAQEFGGPLGHIHGALPVPLDRLRAELARPGSPLQAWRERSVVAVCRTDNRAAFAARILLRAGFSDVHVMSGGMSAWNEAAFACEREPPRR